MMRYISFVLLFACLIQQGLSQDSITLKKKDRKRDVELVTNYGNLVLRLSDSTPLHRDNFLRLVKAGYFDSLLFHRVINHFMIQSGDPDSKLAEAGQPLGNGGPGYRVPAEFRPTLFHRKGALGAARDNNPAKESSGSQFYIVQGKVFTDAGLDSVQNLRLHFPLPPDHREVYKTEGGSPHLDQSYTVFGQLQTGFDVLDKIASVKTSKDMDRDRPLGDVRILKARLIKRKKYR